MNIPLAPGVFDILPNDPKEQWRSSYLWNDVESQIRKIANEYGFQEIRTPLFERTELFKRSVGESSDIVSKEMYTFDDKGGRSLTLRPEGTASVMRAFVEHQLQNTSQVFKYYYIGPMFRYERAQAGRYRQHHQFGAEAIGNHSPEQDAEMIDLIYTLYHRLGIKNLKVSINSIGDTSSRLNFRNALQGYLKTYFNELSPESQTRFETNPLRILDSKNPNDRKINAGAPSILDFLNEESRDHFEQLQKFLNDLKIPYEINSTLVRGLDYYNKTVYEIVAGELGAQNSIAGGGRYDGLMKSLGGPDLPATGFATGLERVIQTMLKQEVSFFNPYSPALFIIALGEPAKHTCFTLLHELRQRGIPSQMDFSGKKVNKAMQYANQINARYVAVIGDNELQHQEVELKEMATGITRKVPLDQLSEAIQEKQSSSH